MFAKIKRQIWVFFRKMALERLVLGEGTKSLGGVVFVRGTKSLKGFTLPEVIISFSVLILVITTATGVLVSVMRSNSDNVNSLIAYGLAQEGVEAMRFVRDSNVILGLEFNGATKAQPQNGSKWGAALFEENQAEAKYFTLDWKKNTAISCNKDLIQECLPLKIRAFSENFASWKLSPATQVYKKVGIDQEQFSDNGKAFYYQTSEPTEYDLPTQFHRIIRVEPVKSINSQEVNKLRISVIVAWTSENAREKEVVLTTELTDWK